MKKSLFLLLTITVCYTVTCTGNANAQVTVVLTPEGKIISMYGTNNSPITYQSGSDTGFRRLGNMDLHYTPNSQILKRIGAVPVTYQSRPALRGKIDNIGDLRFNYYTSGANSGKISHISNRKITYDSNGRLNASMRLLEKGGGVEVIMTPLL